jgi:hypothetical protein
MVSVCFLRVIDIPQTSAELHDIPFFLQGGTRGA